MPEEIFPGLYSIVADFLREQRKSAEDIQQTIVWRGQQECSKDWVGQVNCNCRACRDHERAQWAAQRILWLQTQISWRIINNDPKRTS